MEENQYNQNPTGNIAYAENTKQNNSAAIDFKALFNVITARWYWFVISIAITMSVAFVYLSVTPKHYTRRTTLLIKDEAGSASTNSSQSALASLKVIQSNVNLENEMGMLTSPLLMKDVVNRLSINNFYSSKSGLKTEDLYKKTPVIVIADDPTNSTPFSFDMVVSKNGTIEVNNIVINKKKYDRVIQSRVGASAKLPNGMTITFVRPQWNGEEYYGKKISFSHVDGTNLAKRIAKSLSTQPIGQRSTAIAIRIWETSEQRGDDILRTLIQVYNEHWLEDRNQVATSTSRFIDERLNILQQELGNVDSDISSYKSANLVPDVGAASTMFMQQSAASRQNIYEITNQISMAKMIRSELAKGGIDAVLPASSIISNTGIQGLMDEYNAQVLERNRLLATSSDRNPVVTDMSNSLRALRANINRSLDTYISTLNTQLMNAEQQESTTTSHLAASPGQAKYLLSVERQQKVKEALYLYLLQKREENELGQAFTAYNSKIIEEPDASYGDPVEPQSTRILTIAFFIGLFLPLIYFYCRIMFDSKVRTKRDLTNLSAPYLGEIPLTNKDKRIPLLDKTKIPIVRNFVKTKRSDETHNIAVSRGSRDAVNEAFRVLRTNLEFIIDSDRVNNPDAKVLAITSANPASGKTFTALNLAKVLAIKDVSVVVIDLDLRRGSLSKFLGKPKEGVTDYLVGKATLNEIIRHGIDNEKDFDAIAIGSVPPNPAELLSSARLDELINELKKRYDFVILDCPPAEVVTDALVINRMADRTIFIVRAGLFDKEMIPEVETFFQTKRYKNLTILLNGTDIYGGYGYSRYGYKYGYRYGSYHSTYGND